MFIVRRACPDLSGTFTLFIPYGELVVSVFIFY